MNTKKFATGIKIFGGFLFFLCAGGLIWSLTRPAVTDGPMPPEPEDPGFGAKLDASE